jgi:hypothetical protein
MALVVPAMLASFTLTQKGDYYGQEAQEVLKQKK